MCLSVSSEYSDNWFLSWFVTLSAALLHSNTSGSAVGENHEQSTPISFDSVLGKMSAYIPLYIN